MPGELIFFDEWHLHWWLDPEANVDGERLRTELNAPEVTDAVERAVREAVSVNSALRGLFVAVAK